MGIVRRARVTASRFNIAVTSLGVHEFAEVARSARGITHGNVVSRALSAAVLVKAVAQMLSIPTREFLREEGYTAMLEYNVSPAILPHLRAYPSRITRVDGIDDTLEFWDRGALCYHKDSLTLYSRDFKASANFIQEAAWKASALKCSYKRVQVAAEEVPDTDYNAVSLSPYPTECPNPLHPIDLSVYRGRSLFLVGPSGAGKTTMVRAACKASGSRLLVITAEAFAALGSTVATLASVLSPDVLLIEDMQEVLQDRSTYPTLLDSLEALNGSTTCIGTIMDERVSFEPGDLSFPGMRPGRVDSVIIVKRPDADERRAILTSVCGKAPEELIEATAGLTPAYIVGLVKREGWETTWRDDLATVKLLMPRKESADE